MTVKRLAAGLAALVLMTTASAAQTKAPVAGAWAVMVEGNSAHPDMKGTLELQQDGTKVTGEFTSPHSGMQPVAGEFKDGTLSLAFTTADGHTISFSATLRDADTLSGYLSTPGGDLKWTGTRVKDRR